MNVRRNAAVAHGDGTVGKALDVLDHVSGAGRPVRLVDLQALCPYPKATLYRLLQTLTNQGMVAHDPVAQTYAPGLRLVRLAHAAWRQSSLAPVAGPHLDDLAAKLEQTLHLAQLDHGQVLYVDKRNASQPVEMYSQAGKIGPAYCTGVGKAMLAWLPENDLASVLAQQSWHSYTAATHTNERTFRSELQVIRSTGYAFDREEHEPGIICLARPILSANGRVLGALSVTGSTATTSLGALESHAPQLSKTADAIASDLENWRFPEVRQTQQTAKEGH
ncbi:MAG: IclR family transcriptional regulator [Pseudomonadota bacterium]